MSVGYETADVTAALKPEGKSWIWVEKLLYFAHGTHLAVVGKPLLIDTFEAGVYGPMLPPFRRGRRPWQTPVLGDARYLDLHAKKAVEVALQVRGEWDSDQLIVETLEKYSPWWWAVREAGGKPGAGVPISNESIRKHFTKYLNPGTKALDM